MYQTLRKLGYFKFSDEFKKSISHEHSRVYGLVHIYAELVPLLVSDLDGSNDCPNREKGQFGQNGGVGLNEGVGETLISEGFEYAEDCEVSNATEGMDASVLGNVWNYLMLSHSSDDDDADVGKEGKVPGYEIDRSASSDPGNYDSSDSEEEDTGIKRSSRSITYDPDNPTWLVGMVFNNAEQFRHVVRKFIVKKGYDLRFRKNDSEEVRAWCKPGYYLMLYASKNQEEVFQIKTSKPKHKCFKETNRDSGATSSNKQSSETPMNVLNSSTQSDVNIVGNKSEEEQKFSMHQVDQENVKGPLKMKNADTGSTVRQASTAAKLNQPAQEFIGELQSVRYIQVKLGKGAGGDAKPMNVVFSVYIPINLCIWKSITSSVHDALLASGYKGIN
ncbi:hypothetical protein Peur_005736 [Populus x canadensis]